MREEVAMDVLRYIFEEARPVLETGCSKTAESGAWVAGCGRGEGMGEGEERHDRERSKAGGAQVSAEDG